MPGDLPKLRPVDPTTVANRFRFNGRRKRCRQGDDLMAEITADHLAKARPRDGTRPKWRQISEGIPVTVMGGFPTVPLQASIRSNQTLGSAVHGL